MEIVGKNALIALGLDNCENKDSGFASKFFAWDKISKEQLSELLEVGSFVNDPERKDYSVGAVDGRAYWSPETPIELSSYPYAKCKVFKHSIENCYFFIYDEFGGHLPEKRCRLIRSELIL